MKRKALALLLALCMALSMLPVGASAARPEGSGKLVPGVVGTLEAAAVAPNAKSYSVTLTSSGKGEAELLVDSPAQAGSEVYFMANPDDGYLAEIYYEGLEDDALVYVGADVVGFIMPANKVKLEVKFVAAEGEAHSVEVHERGSGEYALSRTSAKPYESVLLAVKPSNNTNFDPENYVWCENAALFYLFEDGGIHYYEIIMGSENVKIFLSYRNPGYSYIDFAYDGDPFGGSATAEPRNATVNDLVTVTVAPNPGFRVVKAQAIGFGGAFCVDLTPIGNNQYTFYMPPDGVWVNIVFEAVYMNVAVNAGPGGTASTDVTRTKVATTVTLTCVPDEGYQVAAITGVDGLEEIRDNVYWFTMPARDVTIDVTFKTIYNPITVTVENDLGGIADTDLTEAKAGDTVTLTCTPLEGYRLARITGVEDLTDHGDGTYTFTMPDKAVDIQVLFLRHENPFFDVNETHFFYDSVLWAAKEGITSGISATEFGPFTVCNRAQVVTFLWRYAGSPEPESTDNPFTDVESGWYEKAVLWAVEKGITMGISPTEFGPGLPCNRAQVVTFLWRLMGQPEPTLTENPFTDVDPGWYEKPVLWALEKGITTGATADTFNPNGQCQRAQVVTFLYRTAQLPPPAPAVYALNAQFDEARGTVTLSHTEAQAGETITVTVAPAEGWQVESVACLGGTGVTQVSDTEYTFVMPEHEETVTVTFTAVEEEPTVPVKTYTLDVRTNINAEITYVDGKTAAAPGESIFFYVIPEAGYRLTGVGVFNPNNEIDVSKIKLLAHEENLYEFVMIDHDIILNFTFG